MKKLRKLLIALAVLALLVSSVTVLVVTAEDVEYTGDLAKAQELFDAVPGFDENSTTDLRKEAIKKVYNYLRQNPVDPEVEGYAEFAADLYDFSLRIANKYHDKLVAASSKTDKEKALTALYAYIEICPIPMDTPDPDGDGTEYISYAALFESLESINYNMMKGYYDTAVSKLGSADIASARSNLASLYVHVGKWPLLDPEAKGYETLHAQFNELSVRITETIIADLQVLKEDGDTAAYKAAMQSNLPVMRDHMEKCPVDLESFPELTDRYNAIAPATHVIELDQIVFLFEDFENFEPVDDATVMPYPELAEAAALAKVSKALSDSTIPEDTEGYAELVAKIADAENRLASVKEERRLELAADAKLYEFELTNNMSYKTFSSDTETMGNPNADAGEYSERVKTDDNGLSSGYEAYWRYVVLGNPQSNYSYASLTQSNITNGYVVSFDYMLEGTNGTHYDKATFSNEWQNSKGDRLVGYEGYEFTIGYDSATDSIYVSTGNGISPAVVVKNVAAEGQWFNVMYTYDPVTHYGDLYIDYEHMFRFYFNGYVDGATRMVMRISHQTAWQNTCYDNVSFYEGTAYRDVNQFNGMTENELFEFYVNYFLDNNKDSKSRNTAYNQAKMLVDGIKAQYESLPEAEMTDELKALRDLVEQMELFNYDDMIAEKVKEANLLEIQNQVAALEAIPAYSTNVDKINSAIATLDQFIADNNDFINKADPAYNAAVARVSVVKANLVKCENVVAFARALTLFERATTVASMTRRFAAVNEIFVAARYDKIENVNAIIADPALTDFEQILNGKSLASTDPAYITAFEYYEMIPSIIAEQQKVENSNRIIKCIDLLLAMDGYENTEEFWLANYDDVEFFVSIIRDIISADNYDPTYPEIDEAIAQYELIDAYFYVLLQNDHIENIGTELQKFANSKSYIEKIGICTYIDRYFELNQDIDLSLPEIQEFLYMLERYKAELETYMDDYTETLEKNTQYFIDTIQKMRLLTTYAELKPLYDQALGYYYAMNVISEEAKAAVELFDVYDEQLTAIQLNSELFIVAAVELDYVSLLGVEAEYMVLSQCSEYYEYVDTTYSEDIAPKIALYEELVASYNLAVDSANATLETSSVIVASLRSNAIPVAVLAVINQLYKN